MRDRQFRPETAGDVTFVRESRGGWDEWSDAREVVTTIEIDTPDMDLSPYADVVVHRDGEEFDAQLVPDDFDRRQIRVEGDMGTFTSDPLGPEKFDKAWGDWLFPSDPEARERLEAATTD